MTENREEVIAKLIQSKPRTFWLFQRLTNKIHIWAFIAASVFVVLAVSDIAALEIARSLGRQVSLKKILLLDLESLLTGATSHFVLSRLRKHKP